jgi:GTP-binding protein
VLNKIDIADPEKVESTRRSLAEFRTVVQVSAATQQGLKELVYLLANTLDELPRQPDVFAEGDDDGPVLINLTNNPGGYSYRTRQMSRRWEARFDEESGAFVVAGKGIERVVAMTPLLNEHAVARLQRVLEKAGIVSKLRSLGAKEGDTVRIGTAEFDFFDEDIDE